jgi:hypothetical protein
MKWFASHGFGQSHSLHDRHPRGHQSFTAWLLTWESMSLKQLDFNPLPAEQNGQRGTCDSSTRNENARHNILFPQISQRRSRLSTNLGFTPTVAA